MDASTINAVLNGLLAAVIVIVYVITLFAGAKDKDAWHYFYGMCAFLATMRYLFG